MLQVCNHIYKSCSIVATSSSRVAGSGNVLLRQLRITLGHFNIRVAQDLCQLVKLFSHSFRFHLEDQSVTALRRVASRRTDLT